MGLELGQRIAFNFRTVQELVHRAFLHAGHVCKITGQASSAKQCRVFEG